MFDFQHSTEQAKRLILEAPDNTRKTFISLLVTAGILLILLLLSWIGTSSSWTCELDNTDLKHGYICRELRQATSCRTITGPIRAEIMLDINSEVKASALVVCPFENAISELRICFILVSLISVVIGMIALSKENRRQAEMHINSSYFFCALLVIAATFDLFSIWGSQTNNYNLCTLTEDFEMEDGVTSEKLECTYSVYNMLAYFGFAAAVALGYSGYQVSQWKQILSVEGF